ncbi:uracil-DNA glycosylase family protein [uncultured Sphingomonas sp.]|uniref:uracil-DNA glycosylase family protein n=1 Tax=uncultured Sphingomonas sp. TaxID=158754 RepID=UPI0025CD2205|nr:uracil-DNA glycosylase family protein [uncultured Sphingomonas sp.]
MLDRVAHSALDWWVEAGVDVLVDDGTRNWLAPAPDAASVRGIATAPDTAAALTEAPPAILAPAAAPALPNDLAGLRAWLLTDAGLPGSPAARIDALGDSAHGSVVVVDMPEAEDRAAGTLMSGDVGALFDRMLGAMNLGRDRIYMLPFAPARPAGGRIAEADAHRLADLLRHHLMLAKPRRLLLLGDAPVRALTGKPLLQTRDAVHQIALADGTVPAVATFHPRIVHARPDYRQQTWADLQRFMAL